MTDDTGVRQSWTVKRVGPSRRTAAAVCTLACVWLAFSACEQKTPVEPTASTDERSGPASLASLKAMGEGCGVTETATDGSARGFSVPRNRLPFNLPAIKIDPATGRGDGRVLAIRVKGGSGAPITLQCWVSGAASLRQIGDGVRASLDTARWHEMTSNLDRHAPLPDSARRPPPSPAVVEFATEMLAPTATGAGSVGSPGLGLYTLTPGGILKNAPACLGFDDCGCYTVTTTYDDTDGLVVEFFFCDSSDSFNYPWMLTNNYYEFPCGGTAADNRDKLAAMYNNPTWFPDPMFRPSCDQFRSGVSSHWFTWPEFAIKLHLMYNDSLIGYFAPSLVSPNGPDSVRSIFNGPLTFTSVYRDPQKNYNLQPHRGAPSSRHMYGDAVDFANPIDSTSRVGWDSVYNIGVRLQPTTGVRALDTLQDKACGVSCIHMDWQ